MQFLKKHITELCLMLLLCGTLWGAVQLIVSGHIFNGDFALYIRQAQSIQYGDMQQVFSDMQEMIAHSTYQRYSPILYPWGYPLLLFPCVALFGINYFAFKIVGVICLVGAFIFLYYHPILSKERFRMSVLLVLTLLTGNIFYWGYVNSVSSELPFFCFLMFSFWTMNKLYALKEQPEEYNHREGKAANKAELQKQLGLEVNPNKYMIGLISRLTDQKGLDLVRYAMDRLIDDNTQIVVIGTGDPSYEEMFRYYAWCNSDKVSANILYSDDLAHKLYAAADAFLMPSLFEPCGLTQIIAFHYGTIPIVRETGGLKDTVIPLNEFEDTGDGFSFSNYNGDELINTVNYSKYIYFEQPEIWDHMITRAMEKNLSWGVSKRRYEELYNTLIGR